MNKKEVIEEILKIEKIDTFANLNKMTQKGLLRILQSLKFEQETPEKPAPEAISQPKESSKPSRDQMVSCRNITSGKLTYVSKKTGLETVWSNFGDEEYVEVSELLTMKSSQPKFLKEPWLFVQDKDVIDYLGLKNMYKDIIHIDEIDEFFKLSVHDARSQLQKTPSGIKSLLGEKARRGIQDGTLTNIKLIRLLENELNLDLIDLIE